MDPHVFGYGSLVNRLTHAFADCHPARLSGWRRVWVHTGAREVAFLSAERVPGASVLGLVARVPGADWAALDAREWAYARHDVTGWVDHPAGAGVEVQVYAVSEGAAPPSVRHPVLLSYLDAVVQGFLHLHGAQGAAEFFATTAGWDGPILDDRAAPLYPRAQVLTEEERAVVDAGIARVGARVIAG